MDKESFKKLYFEHKALIIPIILNTIIPILITIFIDSPIYFFKEWIINYYQLFLLFLLITIIFIFKRIRLIFYVWIIFIILTTVHSIFLYSNFKTLHSNKPQINFYGLYDFENSKLKKTNENKLIDNSVIDNIEETEFFRISNSYLPNHILYIFEKKEILKFYENKNTLFSILIYKENNIFNIVNFFDKENLEAPSHTIQHLELIKNIFSEILNLDGSNKEEVIKDLILLYQQNFIRVSSLFLLNHKIYDYQKAYDTYNISTSIIYDTLQKYKRIVTNSDIINKIDFLLNTEQATSKYILASINIVSYNYNDAIKNLILCLQLSPYYPYDNYDEFSKAYKAYFHINQVNAIDFLKTKAEYSDIFDNNGTNPFRKNNYTKILSDDYLEITPPFFIIKDIIIQNKTDHEIHELIENNFRNLLNSNNIFKFYFSDIIKFLPKGENKIRDIYIDRVDESKELLLEFMKLDNSLNDIIFQKLIAVYKFKTSYENKDYSKEISKLINEIGNNRLEYGPTP